MKTTVTPHISGSRSRRWHILLLLALVTPLLPGSTFGAAHSTNQADADAGIDVSRDTSPPAQSGSATITSVRPIRPEPVFIGAPLPEPHEVAWLGVSTQEAPEVLTSQMNLEPGVGLVITFVVEDSPAAKAGLERNDLLVGFDDQSLVHPAQLRKLVQSREEGDSVRLTYYRNGSQQQVELNLGKTRPGPFGNNEGLRQYYRELQREFGDVNLEEALREPLAQMRESLNDVRINRQEIREQVYRAMEQARRAANNPEVQKQIRHAMEEARRVLKEAHGAASTITIPSSPPGHVPWEIHRPKVTIHSSEHSAQSVVQTDETGTYVLVRNPRLRLTAHDREGELLFDGEIETEDQRASVPPELWEKVKPLVEKLSASDRPSESGPPPFTVPDPVPAPPPGAI